MIHATIGYKEIQKNFRDRAAPKLVDTKKYDKHDKLIMEKSTLFNRKYRRLNNRQYKYKPAKVEPKYSPHSNHTRHLMRRNERKALQHAV